MSFPDSQVKVCDKAVKRAVETINVACCLGVCRVCEEPDKLWWETWNVVHEFDVHGRLQIWVPDSMMGNGELGDVASELECKFCLATGIGTSLYSCGGAKPPASLGYLLAVDIPDSSFPVDPSILTSMSALSPTTHPQTPVVTPSSPTPQQDTPTSTADLLHPYHFPIQLTRSPSAASFSDVDSAGRVLARRLMDIVSEEDMAAILTTQADT